MCIFSRPINQVDQTQIFARRTTEGNQFLVYQMRYDSSESNAMILPLPVRDAGLEKNFQFIDFSGYPQFFADLDNGFPFIAPQFSIGCSQSKTVESNSLDLKVDRVGNYIASLVPSLSDFSRLDRRFRLADGIWEKLPQYRHFAFAVFQLEEGNLKPHPMAMNFKNDSEDVYFPTLHIHDGEIHTKEVFDHTLYLQHGSLDAKVGGYRNRDVVDRATKMVRSQKSANHFCKIDKTAGVVAPKLLVHRFRVEGEQKNEDTLCSFSGNPEVASLSTRSLTAVAPWIALFAAGKWFLHRRARVQAEKRDHRAA